MSEFKTTGTITKILTKIAGQKKDGSGEWVKQEFILYGEKYNNIFCFEIFGLDKVENFNKYNKEGDQVEVTFNVSCNKWEDRYFTSLPAWKVFKAGYKKENNQSSNTGDWNPNEDDLDIPF